MSAPSGPPSEGPRPGDQLAQEVRDHLRSKRDEMVEFLTRLARAESPTTVPAAQDVPLSMLCDELEELGWRTRRVPGRDTGGHLLARPEDTMAGAAGGDSEGSSPEGRTGTPEASPPFQLLLGHCDTVWPVGTLEEMPLEVEDGILKGPGVFDMKGGLVQLLFALRTLRELELTPPLQPVVFVNSDEETGSRESRRWIRMLARRATRAFVFEPALGPSGALKTARKGTGSFEIRIRGRRAHVGLAPEEGASAIQELARLVQALHGLTDPERGVSVNVGEIEGGTRPNVVAAAARAAVDVRVPSREEAQRLEDTIRQLESETPGTSLEVEGSMGRPPMERTPGNRALWRAARHLGGQLGLQLEETTAGGASDGNLTSQWVPTLDGLGPVGDGAHAPDEHVRIDALPERAALATLLLLLPREPGEVAASTESRNGREVIDGGAR